MIAESSIDWTAEWREKGLREGRRQGRKEGEAGFLLRMLQRLHGPLASEIEERVRGAETDQLLEWGERLVTADSLEEVFGNNNGQ